MWGAAKKTRRSENRRERLGGLLPHFFVRSSVLYPTGRVAIGCDEKHTTASFFCAGPLDYFFIVRSNRGTSKLASFGSLNFLYDQNDRNSCTAEHMEAAFVNHCHLSEKNLHFTELCLTKIVWRLMKFTIGE